MPVNALRSLADEMDRVLRWVDAKRVAQEMAQVDRGLHFKYFKGLRPEKIGRGTLKKVVQKEILAGEGNELFANLLILHWNQNQHALYRDMVRHVQTINEDVEAIEEIEDDKANAIIDDLLERYDRRDILACVRLNGVRFNEPLIVARLTDGAPDSAENASEGNEEGTSAG